MVTPRAGVGPILPRVTPDNVPSVPSPLWTPRHSGANTECGPLYTSDTGQIMSKHFPKIDHLQLYLSILQLAEYQICFV